MRFLIFILFILISPEIFSQKNNFRVYSIEDGLSQSTVLSLCQDSRGYLWIGTQGGGLCRFDGMHFRAYNKKDGLSSNSIRCISEDKKGILWIGTDDGGINLYDGVKFTVIDTTRGLSHNSITKIFTDRKGNTWVATCGGGLNKVTVLPGNKIEIIKFSSDDGITNNFVFDIYEDVYGRIWLALYNGGINVLTFSEDRTKIVSGKKIFNIPSETILCIAEDKKKNIWFGSYDAGAFEIITSGRDSGKVNVYNTTNGLSDNTVWDILSDSKGNLWFATNKGGLVRMNQNGFVTLTQNNGLPNNQTFTLYEDIEKNIWIGTVQGGLCRLIGEHFAHFDVGDGLLSNIIFNIKQDAGGNLWIASDGGGLSKLNFTPAGKPVFKNFTTKDGLIDNFVKSITVAPSGDLWIATFSGICKYDGNKFTYLTEVNSLINNEANCIFADSKGDIWVGTKAGISVYLGSEFLNLDQDNYHIINNQIQTIIEDPQGAKWIGTLGGIIKFRDDKITNYNEADGLLDKSVYSLVCDPKGNIWIGTFGGGLYKFNVGSAKHKPIYQVATDKILSSNNIYSMIFTGDHTLIVGTDKGFDKLTFDDSLEKITAVKNYDKSDGFEGVENNLNAIYKDVSGNIWFGTVKGLTRYNPAAEDFSGNPPVTHITGLKLSFEEIDWRSRTDNVQPWFNLPDNLSLTYSQNHLTFIFTGISLRNPQRVQYRYMLDGMETEWSPPRKENEVRYPGLAPGDYTFKVIAVNEFGVWNKEPATFGFTIKPPVWKTWWFLTALAFLVVIGFFAFVKLRERKLKRDKAALEQIVKERTAEVVRQKEQIELQKEIVEEQKKEITDSIHYASRIQRAILPKNEYIREFLPDYFILYKPRDIVSGDFYWIKCVETRHPPGGGHSATSLHEHLIFCVADCTGHGVPGAFMSMLGLSFLNEIINVKSIYRPADILNHLRQNVINALQQTGISGENKDGMDIALFTVEKDKHVLHYAGASIPLYLLRKGELREYKADKMPIAIYDKMDAFSEQEIPFEEGDTLYAFTDGYADQFGGPRNKKLTSKRLKSLLLANQNNSMPDQKDILNKTIEDWKAQSRQQQIDDICGIGVRI